MQTRHQALVLRKKKITLFQLKFAPENYTLDADYNSENEKCGTLLKLLLGLSQAIAKVEADVGKSFHHLVAALEYKIS